MAARRPPNLISSMVTYSTTDDEGNRVALRITAGSSYEVSTRQGARTGVAFFRARQIEKNNQGWNVKGSWIYTKRDVLANQVDEATKQIVRDEPVNALFLSTETVTLDPLTFLGSIAFTHNVLSFGFYGKYLSDRLKKEKKMFVYGFLFHHRSKTLERVPLPRFDNEEAGLNFPQPSTGSSEQARARVGEGFIRTMKATTGSFVNRFSLEVDFAVFADCMYSVPHRVTPATVRIIAPLVEHLAFLCDVECLTKMHQGQDLIRCVVDTNSLRLIYNLKTFRLGVQYRFTRERRIRERGCETWLLLDSPLTPEFMVQVTVNGVNITDTMEEGGLVVDETTTFEVVRELLNLNGIDIGEEAFFFLEEGRVSLRREPGLNVSELQELGSITGSITLRNEDYVAE